jgi:hypothetical protein
MNRNHFHLVGLSLGIMLAPAVLNASTEERVHKLFERLVNLHDKGLSWKCFTQKMSALLRHRDKYHKLADKFATLSDYTNAVKIGMELKPHEEEIPEPALSLYNKLSYSELYSIIKARIALNEHTNCDHHHKDDL